MVAAAVRSLYRREGALDGELPAATVLRWVDDGEGSWDEEAEAAGVEWDHAARRPGEEWPLDYQAALYWPEAGPDPVVRRGGEHER